MCDAQERQKPFMGQIKNWRKVLDPKALGLGYAIAGRTVTYNTNVQTSFVVSHDSRTGIIETNNSIYYLVGAEGRLDV